MRTRFVSEEPKYNGTCLESMADIDNCNMEPCLGKGTSKNVSFKNPAHSSIFLSDLDIECSLPTLFNWTSCSATCGGGFKVGIRLAQGDNCTGDDVLVESCNPDPCPILPPGMLN